MKLTCKQVTDGFEKSDGTNATLSELSEKHSDKFLICLQFNAFEHSGQTDDMLVPEAKKHWPMSGRIDVKLLEEAVTQILPLLVHRGHVG
jgi:hypothetical protein